MISTSFLNMPLIVFMVVIHRLVKIWDYQNKACVQTLEGHAQNVTAVAFHPELPIILTGSEDGTIRIWHASTYRLETTLNYGLERVWSIAHIRGSNDVGLGFDEGSVMIKVSHDQGLGLFISFMSWCALQLGREEPAVSMDNSGKIIWAKHSEIQQANLKNLSDIEIKDGERLPLAIKDMGSCEIYPQTISHNPNGRSVHDVVDLYRAIKVQFTKFFSPQDLWWYVVMESTSFTQQWRLETRALEVLRSLYGQLIHQSEWSGVECE